MADVMIRCPKTGNAVSTGVGMPWEMFNRPDIVMEGNSVQCQECGQMHQWDKKDAFPDS